MITLEDCRALCDADPALVARIARDQALPEILAFACAQQICHRLDRSRRSDLRRAHALS